MLDGTRVFVENHDQPFTLFHGNGNRLLQALLVLIGDLQLVDDYLDVVVLITVHLHASGDLHEFTVNADVQVALAPHRLEEFAIVTLSALDQRGENENALSLLCI